MRYLVLVAAFLFCVPASAGEPAKPKATPKPTASPQATVEEELVFLRDGTLLRGKIVQLEPLLILLPNGELRALRSSEIGGVGKRRVTPTAKPTIKATAQPVASAKPTVPAEPVATQYPPRLVKQKPINADKKDLLWAAMQKGLGTDGIDAGATGDRRVVEFRKNNFKNIVNRQRGGDGWDREMIKKQEGYGEEQQRVMTERAASFTQPLCYCSDDQSTKEREALARAAMRIRWLQENEPRGAARDAKMAEAMKVDPFTLFPEACCTAVSALYFAEQMYGTAWPKLVKEKEDLKWEALQRAVDQKK